jgi:hypothetical protein
MARMSLFNRVDRVERRPPFGIRNRRRFLLTMAVIGFASIGIGAALNIVALMGLGLCVLPALGMFALGFANAARSPAALEIREEGFVIEGGPRPETLSWSAIKSMSVARHRGAAMTLVINLTEGSRTYNVMPYPDGEIDALIGTADARLAQRT